MKEEKAKNKEKAKESKEEKESEKEKQKESSRSSIFRFLFSKKDEKTYDEAVALLQKLS